MELMTGSMRGDVMLSEVRAFKGCRVRSWECRVRRVGMYASLVERILSWEAERWRVGGKGWSGGVGGELVRGLAR